MINPLSMPYSGLRNRVIIEEVAVVFEVDGMVADCSRALTEHDPRGAVQEIVSAAVSRPGQIMRALGEPKLAGFETLYHAEDLTILKLVWGPGMNLHPHDHCMWAVIGIYGGREDNTFYRRNGQGLQQHGSKVLERGDTAPLGVDIIHSVHNPLSQLTAALHVYGGDFFETPRSEWDPETLTERPFDVEHTRRLFEESNQRIVAAG